jgi:hypothetical protein
LPSASYSCFMNRRCAAVVIFLLFIIAVLAGCSGPAAPVRAPVPVATAPVSGIPVGNGQYTFTDMRGNADRPITIYTYRPAAWNSSGPVLFVMPGAGRSASPSRDGWAPYADRYSGLVIVPEFSLQYYPTDYWYNGGNMFDENGTINPRQNWSFTAIEHIFDDVRAKTGGTRASYLFFGHSAGAQFVHRLVLFLPEARYSTAVAANAGLYAWPTYTVSFPFGLYGSPDTETDLKTIFSRKLIIMSGADDNDPNAGGLANFPEAEDQGNTRFERARNFFISAESEARQLNVPLAWEYHVVPGVGHSESGMAGPSAEILFADQSSQSNENP